MGFHADWTPDETQFMDRGIKVSPPAADDANAPPPLFTAIQDQLGLRLCAEKTDAPVMVIDRIEHPSPN
jgi:uncharacterized protein (TIGR03435 family)